MEEKFSVFLLIYLNPRTPYGVRRRFFEKNPYMSHLNPRTPYGVRQRRCSRVGYFAKLKSTHSIRSATCTMVHNGEIYGYLNPRTPYGVRQQFCIKNIAFLYRLHLFFGQIVCPKKILLFFQRVSSFYQVRISQGFHVHFPFALHKYRIT